MEKKKNNSDHVILLKITCKDKKKKNFDGSRNKNEIAAVCIPSPTVWFAQLRVLLKCFLYK